MRKTNPFLAVLCLSVFACEAPIDLGDRGLEGSGGGTQTTKSTAIGGAAHQTGATFLARCGDGVLQASEVCDDGNVDEGDGCAANCQEIQPGYRCAAPDTSCELVPNPNALCGNGKLEASEPCDDGNTSAGDGCSADCQLEPGWRCSSVVTSASDTASVCLSVCGDGIAVGAEQCDLGTANGTSACSLDCKIGSACGNGRINPSEECDDGNRLDSDGCSRACRIEAGWRCNSVLQGDGLMASECSTLCGDGIAAGTEQCDLGDQNGNGSCNLDCKLFAICGDGIVQPGEECDDGNNNSEYGGCASNCRLAERCGDGILQVPETCDDGNGTNGDGCNAACRVEAGSVCTNSGANCVSVCGDGILSGGEQCDDGNNNGSYGGCALNCVLGPRCGDGIVNGPEQCDDGNNDGGYGECSSNCVLGPRCGDGIVHAGEQCDDGNATVGDGCTASCSIES